MHVYTTKDKETDFLLADLVFELLYWSALASGL